MALNLGTTAIGALYLGSTAISTAYLGSVQVYDAGGAAFDPVSLFASGEEGALFLPGPTTCFTDTAGTTAAGAGDSVARINDTSGNGNHATQATAAARPVLARVPSGGRRNLLEYTEEFDNAAWDVSATATVTENQIDSPLGINSGDLITDSGGGTTTNRRRQSVSVPGGVDVTFSVYAKSGTANWIFMFTDAQTASGAWFDLSNGTVGSTGTGDEVTSISDEGDGWYRCTLTTLAAHNSGVSYANVELVSGDTASTAVTGTTVYLDGAQLEEASTASAYQRVVSEYDVTEAGVDSLWYLDFDGVDDGMATASIDFTSTDKMSVFAGVEKDSESQVGFILETSNNFSFNTGSLYMAVNSSSGTVDYEVTSRGTATAVPALLATSDDAQPALAVISATHDISGDSSVLRVNGAQVDEAMADQGAGNFGDYPLNIGARNNAASVFFDGRIYGLIVRGATSTAQEISDTETFLAARSGVTL